MNIWLSFLRIRAHLYSPCAPNLLHVLVSRILGYHNLCSPEHRWSNNPLRSTDRFRSFIIEFNRSKDLDDTTHPPFPIPPFSILVVHCIGGHLDVFLVPFIVFSPSFLFILVHLCSLEVEAFRVLSVCLSVFSSFCPDLSLIIHLSSSIRQSWFIVICLRGRLQCYVWMGWDGIGIGWLS